MPRAKYGGADTCKGCHDELYAKHFDGTPHFALLKEDEHGCEDCHRPRSAHVDAGGDKTKISASRSYRQPKPVSDACGIIHLQQRSDAARDSRELQQSHELWRVQLVLKPETRMAARVGYSIT